MIMQYGQNVKIPSLAELLDGSDSYTKIKSDDKIISLADRVGKSHNLATLLGSYQYSGGYWTVSVRTDELPGKYEALGPSEGNLICHKVIANEVPGPVSLFAELKLLLDSRNVDFIRTVNMSMLREAENLLRPLEFYSAYVPPTDTGMRTEVIFSDLGRGRYGLVFSISLRDHEGSFWRFTCSCYDLVESYLYPMLSAEQRECIVAAAVAVGCSVELLTGDMRPYYMSSERDATVIASGWVDVLLSNPRALVETTHTLVETLLANKKESSISEERRWENLRPCSRDALRNMAAVISQMLGMLVK